MLCREIHENKVTGCDQEIPLGVTWKYCPRCGRLTGHLETPEAEFALLPHVATRKELRLRVKGNTPVPVRLNFTPLLAGAVLIGAEARSVKPRLPENVEFSLPAMTGHITEAGRLLLESDDGEPRADGEPWQPRPWIRRRPITLQLKIERPGELRFVQEIILLGEQTNERIVEIENIGDNALDILGVRKPRGYQIGPFDLSRIAPHGKASLNIRRDWSVDALPISELVIETNAVENATISLPIYCGPRRSAQELPRAIVGIDFGTAYTSVTFRECRYDPGHQDTVEFLKPPNEPSERFRTRLWMGIDGSFMFGNQATEQFKQDETQGYLFREIKTLLRKEDHTLIHPASKQGVAVQRLEQLWKRDWTEKLATKYLNWLLEKVVLPKIERTFGSKDVNVRYVFSVPVLDYATDKTVYNLQFSQMKRCVEDAGFPVAAGRVDFPMEPVCAALGLIYSTDESKIPRLNSKEYPINPGDYIAIFDSGGGTTDIVLAKLDIKGDKGRLEMHVEHCLGVDSALDTFGGEWVTNQLLAALENKTVPGTPNNWYSGDLVLDNIFDLKDELARDDVDELKKKLDQETRYEYIDSDGDLGTIHSIVLTRLMKDHLQSLAGELLDRVFADVPREQVRYYIPVGGNTALSDVQTWIQHFMLDDDPGQKKRCLQLPDASRQLAIAYGAAWVPDARIKNAVPYDLSLRADGNPLVELRKNTSQETYNWTSLFNLPPQGAMVFDVQAEIDNRSYRLETATIVNPEESLEMLLDIFVDIQNGMVTLDYGLRLPTEAFDFTNRRPLLSYQL